MVSGSRYGEHANVPAGRPPGCPTFGDNKGRVARIWVEDCDGRFAELVTSYEKGESMTIYNHKEMLRMKRNAEAIGCEVRFELVREKGVAKHKAKVTRNGVRCRGYEFHTILFKGMKKEGRVKRDTFRNGKKVTDTGKTLVQKGVVNCAELS